MSMVWVQLSTFLCSIIDTKHAQRADEKIKCRIAIFGKKKLTIYYFPQNRSGVTIKARGFIVRNARPFGVKYEFLEAALRAHAVFIVRVHFRTSFWIIGVFLVCSIDRQSHTSKEMPFAKNDINDDKERELRIKKLAEEGEKLKRLHDEQQRRIKWGKNEWVYLNHSSLKICHFRELEKIRDQMKRDVEEAKLRSSMGKK